MTDKLEEVKKLDTDKIESKGIKSLVSFIQSRTDSNVQGHIGRVAYILAANKIKS